MSTFDDIIKEFTGSQKIGMFMIHLERAKERLPYIIDLQARLKMTVPIYPACEGAELVRQGHPIRCITNPTGLNRSPGDVGCTVSHINICKYALENNYDHIVIFEDDCKMTGTLDNLATQLAAFRRLGLPWDLFLLGGHVTGTPIAGTPFSMAREFFLTHACLLNRTFMKELITLYETYYENNTTFAIDGLYSNVLKAKKAQAYGFTSKTAFFDQYNGIYSYIVEGIRCH